MKIQAWLLGAAMLVIGAGADARPQVYRLNYGDQVFQGQSVVHLKQDLRTVYPNLRINQMDLLSVTVIAKSRMGQGDVYLEVGNWTSQPRNVGGTPGGWQSNLRSSFDQVQFQNRQDSQGVWQLNLQGNIKIREIAVTLDDSGFGPGDPGNPGFPGGNVQRIDCQSWFNRVAYCQANNGRPIFEARLIRQHPSANGQCIQGRTFGTYQGNLWVAYGCQGTFEVRVR